MDSPMERSFSSLGELLPAELQLLQACRNGTEAKIGSEFPLKPSQSNTVRAEVLVFFALGGDHQASVHHHGMRLRGAWIEGQFDLRSAKIPRSIALECCRFAVKPPQLRDAEFGGSLVLSGSWIAGLDLDGSVIRGDVFFDGIQSVGHVGMLGTKIGGIFDCSSAKMEGVEGYALSMDRASIKGSVFLDKGFSAEGQVRLRAVQIGGGLTFGGATLNSGNNCALAIDDAVIQGSVFLKGGFRSEGKISLLGTQIGGDLECGGAVLDGGNGTALSMGRAVIEGAVFFDESFFAKGLVHFPGARIGGDLQFGGANLQGNDGRALIMDRAIINGNVSMNDGFCAEGRVQLRGCRINGDLSFDKSTLSGPSGMTLSMEGVTVGKAFFLRNLSSPICNASLMGLSVGWLEDDENAWGEGLKLDGFVYGHLGGSSPVDATRRIQWLQLQRPDQLGLGAVGLSTFKPQPWLQLQRAMRDMGHEESARQVAIALEDHRRSIGLVGQTPTAWRPWRRAGYRFSSIFLHWAFKMLIGYGYRPLRLVGWMFLVWLTSAVIFWIAALNGVIGPSNPLIFNDPKLSTCRDNWYLCTALPEEYTGFSPLAYSLDVLLPLVNLEQEKDWAPLVPTPQAIWWKELGINWTFKHIIRLVLWMEILFGWIASLLLVAVFSGLTKRREE